MRLSSLIGRGMVQEPYLYLSENCRYSMLSKTLVSFGCFIDESFGGRLSPHLLHHTVLKATRKYLLNAV